MSATCSACKKSILEGAKIYKCAGHGDDMECDNNYTTLCEDCVGWDATEDTYHCSDCFDQLYFTCDCCDSTHPLNNYYYMGECYAGRGCGHENICKYCYHYDDDCEAMCEDCYEAIYSEHCEECKTDLKPEGGRTYVAECGRVYCKGCLEDTHQVGHTCEECFHEESED